MRDYDQHIAAHLAHAAWLQNRHKSTGAHVAAAIERVGATASDDDFEAVYNAVRALQAQLEAMLAPEPCRWG